MLEKLLKHFRSYGMEDLEFIIVNSKLPHSQDKLHELKKLVSFEVYQETDEEPVWSVMEGGKDDMYIYDRCGRLTYYIPFPLSIINESPLVSNAVLATYFRSPCGENCDRNKTFEFDEFVKTNEGDLETANTTEQENSTFFETEQPIYNNETTDEMQFSNGLFDFTVPENNEMNISNSDNTENVTDYDYPTYDNSVQMNETNSTRVDNTKSFFNRIYKLFFNVKINDDKKTENLNGTSVDEGNLLVMTHNDTNNEMTHTYAHHINHEHHKHVPKEETKQQGIKKSDRCLEADYEVCKSWSKKRLLHAQRCCSEIHSGAESQEERSCDNFGKKRCKKLQSILKCCIKTVYTEPAAITPIEESTMMLTPTEESITPTPTEESTTLIIPTEEHTVKNEVADVVCCRPTENGELCRVSFSGSCEKNEYVNDSPKGDM